MIKFNSDNIYVGYIKQLLSKFNLPTVKCYNKDLPLCDGLLYIKDNYIQRYNSASDSFDPVVPFAFNKEILNYTKNLKIKNILYDSHTHEYLGEYLRFIRDFKHVNLMSMYNCFSNVLVDSLYVKLNETEEFKTENHKYKIYCFPVKFFREYTIALSSIEPVEIMCGFYTKSFLDSTEISDVNVSNLTHMKINECDFKNPYVFNLLKNNSFNKKILLEHEKDLKMFIKLPLDNNTSIVVLEGSYLNTNSRLPNNKTKKWENSSTVINYKKPLKVLDKVKVGNIVYPYEYAAYDPIKQENVITYQYYYTETENDLLNDINYLSSLQLLEINSNTSFPFADRLTEYLVDNPITKIESIPDNIERLQMELKRRKEEGFTKEFPLYTNGSEVSSYTTGYTQKGISNFKNKGIWEDKYKAVLYDIAKETSVLDNNFDVLGYLDRNIETKLGSDIDIYSKE